jgi:Inner membrane protein YgaP-like, transmembrane domain
MQRINTGNGDRVVRIALGVLLLVVGWAGLVPGWWALACKLFGLFPLLTGLLGWDPFYTLFGRRTRR